VEWQLSYIPNYTVRSLAIADGKIYVGGQNEFGYFEADDMGALTYTSLVHLLEENARNFSTVWRTHATDQGIFFRTPNYLFRFNGQTIHIWESGLFWSTFDADGEFLVQERGRGLLKLNGDSLEPFPGGDMFADDKIVLLTPLYEGEVQGSAFILGTRSGEFFLFDGFEFQPYETEAADYVKNNKFSQGIHLKSGDTALATLNGGLAIMGTEGELKHVFDKSSGLQDQNVKSVFEDREGNLWLALNKGLTRIEYSSPLFIYDDLHNLPDMVLSVIQTQGYLYAGTSSGLFVLEPGATLFKPVNGVSANCWQLAAIGDSVLAATSVGIFHINPRYNSARQRVEGLALALSPTERNPGIMWCGTAKGLVQLRFEGNRYLGKRTVEAIQQPIRFIVEDVDGILWLVTFDWKVIRLELKKDNSPANIEMYSDINGLPQGELYPSRAAGHVVFATQRGLFRYNERKNAFVPDPLLGPEFAGGEKGKPVFRLREDAGRTIWFHSESLNYRAVPAAGGYKVDSTPFRRVPLIQTNVVYPGPTGDNVFFGNFEGLIRYNADAPKTRNEILAPIIRSITTGSTQVYKGFANNILERSLQQQPEFEYEDRNLQFDFTLPSYTGESKNLYRSVLQGYDNAWSGWGRNTSRNYTNLNAGTYTFKVQARNVFGDISDEAQYRFEISPPLYLTWWAFTLYGMAFIGLMFVIVRWRSHKLVQDKLKLERVVKERTAEINLKNSQLEEKTIELLDKSEKLQEMDKIKSRFFANISHEFRTPLTLIMSPLEQLINQDNTNVPKETFQTMLRNSQRLLTSINQLLDLSRFDSNQMKLQASKQDLIPFIENAVASFQFMAEKKNITLTFKHAEKWMHLYFDTRKIEDVLYNLLVNAVKFTPAGGKVTVSIANDSKNHSPHHAFVGISVKDTGAGIPKDQLEHIFDRFFQADNVQDNAYKGTGIGLALTREIIHLHHGTIDVHSRQGKGTEFVVKLPLGKRHLKSNQIIDVPAKP
jgi:signal transduction histidine kinase